MRINGTSVAVTGGASGLGLATVLRLARDGAKVAILDRDARTEPAMSRLGADAISFEADVTDEVQLKGALESARAAHGPLRAVVHCAGRGGDRIRLLDKEGQAAPIEPFVEMLRVNLVGTYNVLRLSAAAMATNELEDGERGAIVMTASVAAFDGQIGQTSYTASKAAIHGITLVAARDLAGRGIRVNTIAPGIFDTPMLARLREDVRRDLEASVPHPQRLGDPDDYAEMAVAALRSRYLNGETIRLDGAIRMPPR